MSIERRLRRLEDGNATPAETAAEREKRLKMVREGAEQGNAIFFRDLAIERRTEFLESAGYEGHGAGDLRDENFLYAEDEPPFVVAEDGAVFCARDGKPVTEYRQTLAEVWYWREVEERGEGLDHDEEAQAFYTRDGHLALSRDMVNLQHLMGDERRAYVERGGSG